MRSTPPRRTAALAALAVAFGLAGCVPPAPVGGDAPAPPAWAQELLAATNAQRAAAGLGQLTPCPSLSRAAQGHVEDMGARDYFAHTSPEGKTVADRASAAGYGPAVGENIAVGYADVSAVVTAWMNSAGHRANILRPDYQHLGLGRAAGAYQGHADQLYWAQEFGLSGSC